MNPLIQDYFETLKTDDPELRTQAYGDIIAASNEPVDWAYEVWDEMKRNLSHKDNHMRSIAAQILSNLAKSDPDQRMLKDFPELLAVTKDKRFVTARHCLQSLWKIGLAGHEQREMLLKGLENRFIECINEKNCTLIRYDILMGLRKLFDSLKDEAVKKMALAWIELEQDDKYKRKYMTLWRKV